MKKIFTMAMLALGITQYAAAADFSGTYQCHVSDHSDGPFKATLMLKLNPQASFENVGYASYDVDFKVDGMPYAYTGMAAARGNDLALYFESTGDKKNPDDRGVGIASIILNQDESGKDIIALQKFYYEPSYKGKSNYGFEGCIKVK